jgi:hypothetical protein
MQVTKGVKIRINYCCEILTALDIPSFLSCQHELHTHTPGRKHAQAQQPQHHAAAESNNDR